MTSDDREHFPQSVKDKLAARAGHACSYPGCEAPTSGPSNEGPLAKTNTGDAAHIAAASGGPGARRVVPKMTPDQLGSIENGIWLCKQHHKIVDTDEVRFTISVLKDMKALAEKRAQLRQALQSLNPNEYDLLEHNMEITSANLKELTIADAFSDAAIPLLWGKEVSAAARDFVFEISQNALTHGGATRVSLNINPKTMTLKDDGSDFDLANLKSAAKPRGGASALKILESFGARLIFARRYSNGNEYVLQYLRSHADVVAETPCHARVETWNREEPFKLTDLHRVSGCETVHIVLPPFMAHSRAFDFQEFVPKYFPEKRIVFIGHELSPEVQQILARVPNSSYIELPEC
jgi:hypothetical protein